MDNTFIIDNYLFNIDCLHMEQSILEIEIHLDPLHINSTIRKTAKKIGDVIVKFIKEKVIPFFKKIKDFINKKLLKKSEDELEGLVNKVSKLDLSKLIEIEYNFIKFDIDANLKQDKESKIMQKIISITMFIQNMISVKQYKKNIHNGMYDNYKGGAITGYEQNYSYKIDPFDIFLFDEPFEPFHDFEDRSEMQSNDIRFNNFLDQLIQPTSGFDNTIFNTIKYESTNFPKLLNDSNKINDNLVKTLEKFNSKIDKVVDSCDNEEDIKTFRAAMNETQNNINTLISIIQYRISYYNEVIENRKYILNKVIQNS